jgi:glycosyltransferase involved in cell wall biosynthesis
LRALRPEVVHTHSGKNVLLGRVAAHALRVPAVVHTDHGAPYQEYQCRGARLFFRACERHAARRCHALISVADAMTSQMVAARVAPREKFTTIYSGMDVEPFLAAHEHRQRARREFGFGDDDVVVGKIARLFHLKGHEDLIAAARLVVGRHPHLKFLFVGDGVLRPRLEAQIAEAGLADHFRFAGLVPPERIPELIGAMDIVAHTSLREGLARVLPQGLIAGKPVVSYDIDGAREVVLPKETGYLLAPRDTAALAQALAELSGDPELRARLGARGRARFTEQFRHEAMTAQIRGLYEQLLAKALRPAAPNASRKSRQPVK